MRFFNNQTATAPEAQDIPFAGLGFGTDMVQVAAQGMTPSSTRQRGDCGISFLPASSHVPQLCGYDLLVSLGREIRGR
ncbi:hypothetical protein [Pseudodesulfovibrio sediminis]|uniref:Uncharacterized protein n=1 Tax=Pseudodesulfovibrio sediminis TaxID=2810563 RepID=A0ABN6EX37_9BACT|nr:hypothetical protein [Pseudodesulfovibrio sediminis]BCS89740.1 hypothetical protein PSDVSF_29820 [Pseudodesulfovibrio sediminis]